MSRFVSCAPPSAYRGAQQKLPGSPTSGVIPEAPFLVKNSRKCVKSLLLKRRMTPQRVLSGCPTSRLGPSNLYLTAKANSSVLQPREISTLHPAQQPRNNTVPSDKPTRLRKSFAATNTVLPNKRAASPAISQDHIRNVACTMFVPEIGHFLAKYSSARLPYSPARN